MNPSFMNPSTAPAPCVSLQRSSARERQAVAGLLVLLVVIAAMVMPRSAQAAMASTVDVAFAAPATAFAPSGFAVSERVGASVGAGSVAPSRVWPWWRWYRTGISPQFAYRQVVETGPRRGRRAQRFEIRTRYRYVPRRVSRRVADVDVLITGIDVYQRGRFLGSIERIPPRIRRTRARIFRNRPARIDREVAVIGGGGFGYELLALRPGRVWQRPAVLAAARVNVRRGAAIPVRRSSLVYARGARYLTPIPLLPPDIGRISTQLLRYDRSYYDDSRFGSIYDGPRWQYDNSFDRYDRFDDRSRFDDRRFDDRGFEDRRFEDDRRFEGEYDRRFDRDNEPVNGPRTVPRSSPGDDREGRAPFRQDGSASPQFAENRRSEPDRSSQGSQGRGARASIEQVEPRTSSPRANARTARTASRATASRSESDSRSRSRSRTERTTGRSERSTGRAAERATERTASRSTERASGMRMARRAESPGRRSVETSGRSARAMRRTPEAVTGRDTRTVGEGDEAVTVKRETKIVRLDDYEE